MTQESRFADFDAFQAEQAQVGPRIKVGGQVYQLPPDLPATVALRVIRAVAGQKCDLHPEAPQTGCLDCAKAMEAEFSNAEVANLVEQVLGDQAQTILPHVGMNSLPDFLMMVVGLYTGENGGPNRATRRAMGERGGSKSITSGIGPASSPISSGSTESTPQQPSEQESVGAGSSYSSPT